MNPKRVAFQGEAGAYSETAALEHFGSSIQPVGQPSFEDVFQSVVDGDCETGMIPIENSLAGSIHQNYDLLLQNSLVVIAEYHMPIHHCLIVHPGVALDDLRTVISHPQALAQCYGYLRSLSGVKSESVYDTAGSVKLLSQGDDR